MRRGPYYPHLYVVKQDAPGELRLWALSCLIQDRSDIIWSYPQFVDHLKGKVSITLSFHHIIAMPNVTFFQVNGTSY